VSAERLYKAGYTDLVSVVPPGAQLSPNSAIEPSQLGKVPGKRGAQGWYGYSFTKEVCASLAEAKRIDADGANVGLLGNRFPALDIDCNSAALADFVQSIAETYLGEAPIRLSRDPRRLLVYRTDEPFARMALVATHNGKSHLVEMLGAGRQYLVHGTHPSGALYRWHELELWEEYPDNLIAITRESVASFFDELARLLAAKGLEVELIGDGLTREAKAPESQESLEAPSTDDLRKLVARIPNDSESAPTWDDYIKFGHAIKAAAGDNEAEGLEIYQSWVERCTRVPPDTDDAAQHWERMHAPHRVGYSWLVEQAEKFGGYVSAQDEFSADADAKPPEPPEEKLRQVDFTDEWAVATLLPSLSEMLRFAPGAGASGTWFTWAGFKWQQDQSMQHERHVREKLRKLSLWLQDHGFEMLKALGPDATKADKREISGPYFTAAKRFQSSDGINSVVRLLRARVACSPNDFDVDTYALNTPGGVVDLKTGEVREGKPSEMFARSTAVAPSTGERPIWTRFLKDLTGGDEQLASFVQKMCGYALTGDISEKSLWFVWGSDSDTGKSTFIRALSLMFGDYSDSVDIDAFVGGKERIPADLARLPGVRLVTAAEPAAGQSWDERRIKAITGGDEISARFLYGQWFTYVPQFKIIIVGNHSPEIRQVDDAMLRRIHIVPFNRKVPREKQIDNLAKLLVEREGPQILQWLIEGCLLWQKEGLTPPESVLQTTGDYVDEEDTIAMWLAEEVEAEPDAEVSRQELYQAWSAWCRSRGEDPGGAKSFKHKLDGKRAKMKLEETQVGDRRLRGYRGLRLRLKTAEGTEFSTV
jgi:P4 family phage/plasmid primase-like protien